VNEYALAQAYVKKFMTTLNRDREISGNLAGDIYEVFLSH